MKYRVHYHVYAAGGRLWPTWREVEADSERQALGRAMAADRSEEARTGKRSCAWYGNTRVEAAA